MSIPPMAAPGGISVQPSAYLPEAPAAAQAPNGAPGAFAASFSSAVDNLQGLQSTSSGLAVQAVTGDLADVHDYTIAATEAAVALELTAAVRNRAVEAFTEIMRMQA
ncbi:flagellar hook-basal body complex protein FliE [Demequina aestuarii]|uniref:flagellar hook-basal body complex protein FliE n=1 Tax=Demequina aestuarii TaxID=327095 RepID=UPI000A04BF8A|nr:flagellar hook-basal body complex protein FliE [Demequina aestuarii]